SEVLMPGFAVKPIVSRGELRLANTNVGAVAGRNGTVDLADVGFKRIRGGDADVKLESIKLVDSKLEMRELEPDTSFTLKSGEAVKIPSDIVGHWSAAVVREAMELGF